MKNLSIPRSMGIVLLLSFFSFSFMNISSPDNDGWTLIESTNSVDVFVKVDNCNGESFYLFKVANLTSTPIDFEMEVDVTNEPAFGPMLLKERVSANSESIVQCEKSNLKLPKHSNANSDLSQVIRITIKE